MLSADRSKVPSLPRRKLVFGGNYEMSRRAVVEWIYPVLGVNIDLEK